MPRTVPETDLTWEEFLVLFLLHFFWCLPETPASQEVVLSFFSPLNVVFKLKPLRPLKICEFMLRCLTFRFA